MSTTGRVIMLSAYGISDNSSITGEEGLVQMRFDYRYSPTTGPNNSGTEGGSVYVPLYGHTETELTSLAQAKVIEHCNLELFGIDVFQLTDVYGGKL